MFKQLLISQVLIFILMPFLIFLNCTTPSSSLDSGGGTACDQEGIYRLHSSSLGQAAGREASNDEQDIVLKGSNGIKP